MPRQKKQHLKRRKDGRFACRYRNLWFYGETEDEALEARDEYKQAEKRGELQLETGPTVAQYALMTNSMIIAIMNALNQRLFKRSNRVISFSCTKNGIDTASCSPEKPFICSLIAFALP